MHIYCALAVTPSYLQLKHFDVCVQLIGNDFRVLVVTEDSSVVLNQLRVNEQGTYRCSLQSQNGTIFYQVTFLLTGKTAGHKYFTV